ncbi:MAG: hypothetical protein QW128_07435 [Thermoprotei archaeon]
MLKWAPVIFIAWKKLSSRTKLLAKAIGVDIVFYKSKVLYVDSAVRTLVHLLRVKPKAVLLQLPQGPLLLLIVFVKRILGFRVIVDAHSGFLVHEDLKNLFLNFPFKGLLRYVDLIIVHNYYASALLPRNVLDKTIVVYDPWYVIEEMSKEYCKGVEQNYIVIPASYALDEPLHEFLEAYIECKPPIKLVVTGNWMKRRDLYKEYRYHVIFTGYLPVEKYYKLLCECRGVLTGTKREYTALMSAWEAITFSKPLAVNYTKTLAQLYKGYAVFYDYNEKQSICRALKEISNTQVNLLARERLKRITENQVIVLKKKLSALVM